jgi:hypothetical protein
VIETNAASCTDQQIRQIHLSHSQLTAMDRPRLIGELLNSSERRREGCVIVQAGGFILGGKAFLVSGTGTINILEAIAQFEEVDGIVGNGNALFLSSDFRHIYSTLTEAETLDCYESKKTNRRMPYALSAELWPFIFLQRAFKQQSEYETLRNHERDIWLSDGNEFIRHPISSAGRYRSRLMSKLAKTSRVVHCCHRPTMKHKEMLFDSEKDIIDVSKGFQGDVILGYTLYSQDLESILGFESFVKWKDNPSERMSMLLLGASQCILEGTPSREAALSSGVTPFSSLPAVHF